MGEDVRSVRGACEYGPVTGGLPTTQLVLGDEELLVTRAVEKAIEAARAADASTDVRQYEANALAAGELSEMISPSLFGGRRLVVIRNGQDARKDLVAALLDYAKHPDPDVLLVVTHTGGGRAKALADGLRTAGADVVTAAKLKSHRDRVAFVREELKRGSTRGSEEAAEALLAAVGNDLRDLSAACSQLLADVEGRIDASTVARYYRGRAEVTGFTVADAAMVGDVPAALEALRWALHVGVDPVPIADAIADGVRTVARVASAGRGNAYQMASSLGMPAWKIERAQRQGRGWTPEGLVVAMRAAADCNAEVKGGADDRGYALERAVFAVVAARGGGSGPDGPSGGSSRRAGSADAGSPMDGRAAARAAAAGRGGSAAGDRRSGGG
ncbi:DNA polymerase III delta subunit [Asanoa ferruginea]|uniref:DNA polymerase III subunit delta n=1 Tax=Asanoa ferruginea TaxID=53367 RepID=A0A3D9ZCV8_9ACTN|nr:DNA polymerase III delta subunit [Asanoa ferruginea]